MARIELVDLAHAYSAGSARPRTLNWALKPTSCVWEDGGAYALLGPSGCGKTTLLNVISGLLTPTQGRVLIDGHDVTHAAPAARNIAQVFQFPVIYDTMTVFDNLAFPLRNRGWAHADIRRRVHEVAELLDLTASLSRSGRALGADDKQKISLGRGLVRPDVAAVLFDEPLTVIDPALKWLLRRKLKEIHRALRLTLLYVTHDQTEALTFADRTVVMAQGEVVQIGTAQELFERPAHRFVGYFIGTPGMNFLPCDWRVDSASINGEPVATASRETPGSGRDLALGIRPEHLIVSAERGSNSIAAEVTAVDPQGVQTMVRLRTHAGELWAKLSADTSLPRLGPAHLQIPPERCWLYEGSRRVP
jgi:glycerol transport system ATP-binding protein